MWKINKHGRTYKNGQSLSADFRMLIIDTIIQGGGNRYTGEVLHGLFTSQGRSQGGARGGGRPPNHLTIHF